jgi:phosphoribosylanthranilate isomerase
VNLVKAKICGITNLQDARAAIVAGADMLGFNFYRPSPRFIDPDRARQIIEELRSGREGKSEAVIMVGVFVNEASPDDVRRIARQAGVDAAQLHGDESSEFCGHLARLWSDGFLIKVLRVDKRFVAEQARAYQTDAIMLDAFHAELKGGSGQVIDWTVARRVREMVPRLFLAGGLSPENVSEAIKRVEPYAVDACSSIESRPGMKDFARVSAFVAAVHGS